MKSLSGPRCISDYGAGQGFDRMGLGAEPEALGMPDKRVVHHSATVDAPTVKRGWTFYEFIKDWIIAMADQFKINSEIDREQNGSSRSSPCLSSVPESSDLNRRYVDITAMIRSLQRTEGTTDCFRSGLADCDHRDCSWRQYCLRSTDDEYSD